MKDQRLAGRSPAALGIVHKLSVDAQGGTAHLSIPIEVTQGRDGFTPVLSLEYRSTAGNGAFGRGWNLAGLLGISLDTSQHLPQYLGNDDFSFSGAGMLVPYLDASGPDGQWRKQGPYRVRRYRPRTGGGHLRIERFVHGSTGDAHWRIRDARDTLSVLGSSADGLSRVSDPRDAAHVFSWLPELQIDARGNAIKFDYVAENLDGVDTTAPYEQANLGKPQAQRYLKRVRWGNSEPVASVDDDLSTQTWRFELVFDYGDHEDADPRPDPDREWPARPDASCTAVPGFAVRTYRLCRRVLLFHRFEELGPEQALVSSYILEHELAPEGSRLIRVRHAGFRHGPGGIETREHPPLDLAYSAPRLGNAFMPVPARAEEQVPHGIDGPRYRLVDLWGEGLPGLLIESTGAWFYRANLGGGRFGAQQLVVDRPSHSVMQVAVHDFDGDGDTELTVLGSRNAGYYAYDRTARSWSSFRAFEQMPHLDAVEDLRWFDADGDGRADLLTGIADRLSWYRLIGKEGFEPAQNVALPIEARGAPWRVDEQNDFFFADMTGDGLSDQVMVRNGNGSVIYWPNLGNGRFGAPVTMDGAPRFAPDGEFDAGRLIFADIDGSGTSDILYVGNGEVTVCTNASGNLLLPPRTIGGLPQIDRRAGLAVFDFLGDGTPCLVWSTHSASGFAPLQYLPLTDGVRPGLLVRVTNNLGIEQRLEYSSSAAHYLRDRGSTREWVTRLPRHTIVVDRHEVEDLIGRTQQATTFRYHDGSFEGRRRTFRGFGFVELADVDPAPPDSAFPATAGTCTRQWFHLGVEGVSSRHAMWRGDALAPDCTPYLLGSAEALDITEAQDAAEAVAGSLVRREIFTLGMENFSAPLRVENRGVLVRRLQPSARSRPACFDVLERESQTILYEQNADDPRMSHALVLKASTYGAPVLSCEIAYPRRASAPQADPSQNDLLVRVRKVEVLEFDEPGRLELALPVSEEEFVIEGLAAPAQGAISFGEIGKIVDAAILNPKPFEAAALAAGAARRLRWTRTFYWNAAGTSALPLGEAANPALIHHREAAAFTPGLVTRIFGSRVDSAKLSAAGYEEKDGHWWRPSETFVYGKPDTFRSLQSIRRIDGGETKFDYDSSLMRVAAIIDAVGNRSEVRFDYHLLEPQVVIDPNGTISEARYDALGVVVATSTSGDVERGGVQQPYGFNPLSGFSLDPGASLATALSDPPSHVGGAASVTFYDISRWQDHGEPPAVLTLTREQLVHCGDGAAAAASDERVLASIIYLDGLGRPLQSKLRIGPGGAITRQPDGSLKLGPDGNPELTNSAERWQVSGHTIYDQRQHPIRKFEPFFSRGSSYEGDAELAAFGAATTLFYDALGRPVREDRPNGTFTRTEYGAWAVRNFDENDTVEDSAYKLVRSVLAPGNPEHKALAGALAHANTPVIAHLDPAGRAILLEESDGLGNTRRIATRYAPDGEVAAIVDPRGITATERWRDMLGRELRSRTSDAGETLVLLDAMDRPVDSWDALGVHAVRGFDRLDRETFLDVQIAGAPVRTQQVVYGDDPEIADAEKRNLRGSAAIVRDGSGERTFELRTIDGLPLTTVQRIVEDVRVAPDWADPGNVALLPDAFFTEVNYDGLGRAVREKLPDGTTLVSAFERGGGLKSIEVTSDDGLVTGLKAIADATLNARSQRETLVLGNGVVLASSFDPETWRTRNIRSTRPGAAAAVLQDIDYVYDPVGNIVATVDKVQQPGATSPALSGLNTSAEREYVYDAFYQLRRATGRVHRALLPDDHRTDAPNAGSFKGTRRLSLNDGAQLERFVESFAYDLAGNMSQLKHVGPSASWTNDFWISAQSNRSLPALDANGLPVVNPETRFDQGGNILGFSHLRAIEWDHRGMVASAVIIDRSAAGQPNDAEFYAYDLSGARVRKRFERLLAGGVIETTDTFYLDGCEIRRVARGPDVLLERRTAYVSDGFNRVAMIHRWTTDINARETEDTSEAKVRYQLADHLGSALLQLDENGAIIAIEEYLPFGGTAFIAGDNVREIETSAYRFCGKERDDATGLYCFGRRYYASWLNRWISADPAGDVDGLNRYVYARNNPVTYFDPDGLQAATNVGKQRTVYRDVPAFVWQVFNAKPAAERERLLKLGGKLTYYVHKAGVEFGTPEEMNRLKEIDRKAGQNIVIIKPPKPPGNPKGKAKKAATPPSAPANDTGDADTGSGGDGPGGDSTKDEKAKGSDAGQAQDGSGGGAQGPDGTSGGTTGKGTGTEGNGDAADPGDGGAAGAQPGNGEGGGEGKGVPQGTGGDGTGLGEKGKGTGGGGKGDAPGGIGSEGGGTGSGSGNGTGEGSGDGSADVGSGTGGSGTSEAGSGDGGVGSGVTGSGEDGGGAPGGVAGGQPGGQAGGSPGGKAGGTADGKSDGGTGGDGGDPKGKADGGVPGVDGKPNSGSSSPDSPDGKGPGTGGPTTPGGNGKGQAETGQAEGPGGKPGGEKGKGPAGGEQTIMDRITTVAGYWNLEFSGNPNGKSGGVPGGFGSHNWGAWGQALYLALTVADIVLTFFSMGGTAGIKATLKAGYKAVTSFGKKALTQAAKFLSKEFWQGFGKRALRAGINWNPFKGRSLKEFLLLGKNQKFLANSPASKTAVEFIELEGTNGGRIWASTDAIDHFHVDDLAKELLPGGSMSSGKPLEIITGTHGSPGGYMSKEFQFLVEDYGIAPAAKNITIHDASKMTQADLKLVLESGNDVVLGWCWSERSRKVFQALGLNFLKAPF
jgi:RHS repeat-associated protein